jgi:hypothetical protein
MFFLIIYSQNRRNETFSISIKKTVKEIVKKMQMNIRRTIKEYYGIVCNLAMFTLFSRILTPFKMKDGSICIE